LGIVAWRRMAFKLDKDEAAQLGVVEE